LQLTLHLTPGLPREFLIADFVLLSAQKVTAEIFPVQPIVMGWKVGTGD